MHSNEVNKNTSDTSINLFLRAQLTLIKLSILYICTYYKSEKLKKIIPLRAYCKRLRVNNLLPVI